MKRNKKVKDGNTHSRSDINTYLCDFHNMGPVNLHVVLIPLPSPKTPDSPGGSACVPMLLAPPKDLPKDGALIPLLICSLKTPDSLGGSACVPVPLAPLKDLPKDGAVSLEFILANDVGTITKSR